MNREHGSVKHSVSESVSWQAHTNGIESFRAGLGMVPSRHLPVHERQAPAPPCQEFAGRHDARDDDTFTMMHGIAKGMAGERLTHKNLVG